MKKTFHTKIEEILITALKEDWYVSKTVSAFKELFDQTLREVVGEEEQVQGVLGDDDYLMTMMRSLSTRR